MVYAAQDEVIGRSVALKVLMADLESDPETRARFYGEAHAAARLRHPNVITIFDAGEDQGRSFIAMQLLEGATLPAYLKRPDAAHLERKVDLMIQCCEGLAAAHGQGLIHRDLKPNNLFVQSDGLLKILDFGIARLAHSRMTPAGTTLGIPDYVSPEQARGAQVDARSDIFSAGAVFYFMLAGRKPFPGADLPNVLRQLQFEEPAPLRESVPQELKSLVQHAMAKAPDGRPKRVEDLHAALLSFRRQYQSETRNLVLKALAQFDAAQTAVASVAEAEAILGLPAEALSGVEVRSIQQRFPLLSKSSAADAVPPDRELVLEVLRELTARQEQLAIALDRTGTLVARLEGGKRSLASGDARNAMKQFEAVAQACPQSARARELMESCRPLAAEQEARAARISASVAAIRRALDAQDWTAAREECRSVLALEPAHQLAAALLREANEGIEREQQRLASIVRQLVDRASEAIERQEFDKADAALKEAETVDADSPAVAQLRQQLTNARAEAEAVLRLHRLSIEEIRRARATFRRGRYDEAVQQLSGFLEVEPAAREAEAEIKRLIALRSAIASSTAASRHQASELVNRAAALAESGDLQEARNFARLALQADPTDAAALTLLDRLLAQQLEERIAAEHARSHAERTEEAEPLLAAALGALERGYVALALQAGLAAQRIAPHRIDAAAFVEEAKSEMTSEDRETRELVAAPFPEPVSAPAPVPAAPAQPESGGVLDKAASLFRGGRRRGKA